MKVRKFISMKDCNVVDTVSLIKFCVPLNLLVVHVCVCVCVCMSSESQDYSVTLKIT